MEKIHQEIGMAIFSIIDPIRRWIVCKSVIRRSANRSKVAALLSSWFETIGVTLFEIDRSGFRAKNFCQLPFSKNIEKKKITENV